MKQKFYFRVLATIFVLLIFGISNTQASSGDDALEEMEIKGIAFDQRAQSPVLFLTDKEQNSVIPIWIGLCEARSIELSLSNIVPPRPLTYDMIAAIIRTLNAKVDRIVIVDLRDEVYYAQLELTVDGKLSKIDVRPSDALALASRMNSPIFVNKSVLKKAALLNSDQEKREL